MGNSDVDENALSQGTFVTDKSTFAAQSTDASNLTQQLLTPKKKPNEQHDSLSLFSET